MSPFGEDVGGGAAKNRGGVSIHSNLVGQVGAVCAGPGA